MQHQLANVYVPGSDVSHGPSEVESARAIEKLAEESDFMLKF